MTTFLYEVAFIGAKALGCAWMVFIGLWLRCMGNDWSEEGEIPSLWIEGLDRPATRSDLGFFLAVRWQKIMVVVCYGFAALLALSIILQTFSVI